MTLKTYLSALGDDRLRPTAFRVALFVGSLYFLINHGNAVLDGTMTRGRWVSVLLSYCVPYCVNIHGQLASQLRIESQLRTSHTGDEIIVP
ncbi:MAG: nitrate/nitrite transporter NrtS [Synechococcus sp.]|nr:nitrate/nitrite transporter NrtS [Synechococcus sp.]